MRIPIPPARAIGMRRLSTVALLALSACAPTRGPGVSALQGKGAVVEVRNDRFDDVVVYLIRGGTQIELGVAPGASRRTFTLSPSQLGNGGGVVLAAGKRGVPMDDITGQFDLAPGRIATWAIRVGTRTDQPLVR